MKFRKDINGLRAIAVVAVVLFHFGIPAMHGGFFGVDIFFVISGFLMTEIIINRLDKGEFSLLGFYFERGRRIVPALAFLCVLLLVLGWFILTPITYRALGKHVAASLTFTSNFIYLLDSNYFDIASREKWLLHTWSLSVEWQFYAVYPIILFLIRKLNSRIWQRVVIISIAMGSYVLCLYLSARWPLAAFYLFPTRAWEMLAGAAVCLYPKNLSRYCKISVELVGIGLICASVVFIKNSAAWSGFSALMPVAGAAFVILANRSESIITGNIFSQFMGKISYSVYLWHWPIVVGLYFFGNLNKPIWVAGAIGASIIAGWLSYTFVETPARKKKIGIRVKFGYSSIHLIAGGVTLMSIIAGATIFLSNGFPKRMTADFSAKTKDLVMPLVNNGWCFYSVDSIYSLRVGKNGLKCELGDKSSHVYGLSFGDSYAGQYDPFWNKIALDNNLRVNSISTNWCYPSFGDTFPHPEQHRRSYRQCLVNRKYLLKNLSDYDFVVLSGEWGGVYAEGNMQDVYKVVSLAAKKTKLVILMAAPTTYDVDPVFLYENSLLLGTRFDIGRIGKTSDSVTRKANLAISELSKKYNNVVYIDRNSLFNIDGVPSDVSKDNVPYSFGGNHISVFGSKSAALAFEGTPLYHELQRRFAQLPEGGAS